MCNMATGDAVEVIKRVFNFVGQAGDCIQECTVDLLGPLNNTALMAMRAHVAKLIGSGTRANDVVLLRITELESE